MRQSARNLVEAAQKLRKHHGFDGTSPTAVILPTIFCPATLVAVVKSIFQISDEGEYFG